MATRLNGRDGFGTFQRGRIHVSIDSFNLNSFLFGLELGLSRHQTDSHVAAVAAAAPPPSIQTRSISGGAFLYFRYPPRRDAADPEVVERPEAEAVRPSYVG